MPPRSKTKTVQDLWLDCSNCKLVLSATDEKNHASLCTQDSPFDVKNSLSSARHGFIAQDTLVGIALIKEGEHMKLYGSITFVFQSFT